MPQLKYRNHLIAAKLPDMRCVKRAEKLPETAKELFDSELRKTMKLGTDFAYLICGTS